jgi:N-acetylglucosamine-6-phosphate deacetylase
LIQPKPEDEKILKGTDWNKMRIQVTGDQVTTWLNDQQIIDIKDEKIGAGKGFIALQIHDGGGIKVRWKNIRVKELKK